MPVSCNRRPGVLSCFVVLEPLLAIPPWIYDASIVIVKDLSNRTTIQTKKKRFLIGGAAASTFGDRIFINFDPNL